MITILRPAESARVEKPAFSLVITGQIAGDETWLLLSAADWEKGDLSSGAIVRHGVLWAGDANLKYARVSDLAGLSGPHVVAVANGQYQVIAKCIVHLDARQGLGNEVDDDAAGKENDNFVYPVQICRSQYSNWGIGENVPVNIVEQRPDFFSPAASADVTLMIVAPDEIIDGTKSLDMTLSIGSDLPAFEALKKSSSWLSGTTYLAAFRDAVIDVKNGIVLFDSQRKAWGDTCAATLFNGGENRSPALIPVEGKLAWVHDEASIVPMPLSKPAMMLSHWASLVNYGHWLMNSLLSVYTVLDELKSEQIFLICPILPVRLREEVLQMGVPESAIIETGAQYVRLDHLIYPSPLSTRANIQPSRYSYEFFDYIKSKFAKKFDYVPPEKIYITRKGFPTLRKMDNEDDLIKSMTSLGLTCIAPHELSFEEQIYAVSNAKLIVGQLGAALWNLPFTPKGGAVIEICTSNYTTNEYFYISHLMQHRFVRIMTPPMDEGGSFKFLAPIEDVRERVKALI